MEAPQGPQGALAEAELALLGVETSTGSILYDEFRHGPLAPPPKPMTGLPFHACCRPGSGPATMLGHVPSQSDLGMAALCGCAVPRHPPPLSPGTAGPAANRAEVPGIHRLGAGPQVGA